MLQTIQFISNLTRTNITLTGHVEIWAHIHDVCIFDNEVPVERLYALKNIIILNFCEYCKPPTAVQIVLVAVYILICL